MKSAFFLILLTIATAVFANPAVRPIQNLPVDGGREISVPFVRTSHSANSLDEIFDAGTTWHDYQHNGTAGKMIGVDENGYVHLVWMNGLDATSASRHVFYNVWDPASENFLNGIGTQADNALRSGYTSMCVNAEGFCFPAWHNKMNASQVFGHAAAALDFLPATGAFTTIEVEWLNIDGVDIEACWPKIAYGRNNMLHMVSTENPTSGDAGAPQRIWYSRGYANYEQFGITIEWEPVSGADYFMLIDTVMVIAPNIACSRYSDRVLITWSKSRDDLANTPSQYNNDLYMMISEDGGLNWAPEINITNFEYPDLDCASGDTAVCNRDTFRVYTDMSVILDNEDNIHIAFTTGYYYSLEGTINIVYSDIWHWGEDWNVFSNMAHGSFDTEANGWVDPGAWQRMVQRPSLAIDTTTGNLYCSFQRYDTLQWSESGWPMGDAYATVSSNNGFSWAEATNITNTDGGQAAPAGQSLSERDITVADYVTYENGESYLHMSYVLDLDAGGVPQGEGVATLNPVQYQRINVDEIATTPIHDPCFPILRVDGTGSPCADNVDDTATLLPQEFVLHQNYPNPFNPSTKIQFDLQKRSTVELTVFNLNGQEISKLVAGESLDAGTHVIDFDASNIASGIYLYRLSADGFSLSREMALIR